MMFQSSAAPKDGCYTSAAARERSGLSFNPQPPRRTAATLNVWCDPSARDLFQSSAAPKDGCYTSAAASQACSRRVSILSRPEGRLLLAIPLDELDRVQFQSSAAPKDGCYQKRRTDIIIKCDGFNPQPPRRTAATPAGGTYTSGTAVVSILSRPEGRLLPAMSIILLIALLTFQSSAAPKDGCYTISTSSLS